MVGRPRIGLEGLDKNSAETRKKRKTVKSRFFDAYSRLPKWLKSQKAEKPGFTLYWAKTGVDQAKRISWECRTTGGALRDTESLRPRLSGGPEKLAENTKKSHFRKKSVFRCLQPAPKMAKIAKTEKNGFSR